MPLRYMYSYLKCALKPSILCWHLTMKFCVFCNSPLKSGKLRKDDIKKKGKNKRKVE